LKGSISPEYHLELPQNIPEYAEEDIFNPSMRTSTRYEFELKKVVFPFFHVTKEDRKGRKKKLITIYGYWVETCQYIYLPKLNEECVEIPLTISKL